VVTPFKQFVMGFLGASIVSIGPLLTWIQAFVGQTDPNVLVTQWISPGLLGLSWLGGLLFASWEPEPHLYGSFLKGAGIPGLILGMTHFAQLPN
jgi:hypothetical protein